MAHAIDKSEIPPQFSASQIDFVIMFAKEDESVAEDFVVKFQKLGYSGCLYNDDTFLPWKVPLHLNLIDELFKRATYKIFLVSDSHNPQIDLPRATALYNSFQSGDNSVVPIFLVDKDAIPDDGPFFGWKAFSGYYKSTPDAKFINLFEKLDAKQRKKAREKKQEEAKRKWMEEKRQRRKEELEKKRLDQIAREMEKKERKEQTAKHFAERVQNIPKKVAKDISNEREAAKAKNNELLGEQLKNRDDQSCNVRGTTAAPLAAGGDIYHITVNHAEKITMGPQGDKRMPYKPDVQHVLSTDGALSTTTNTQLQIDPPNTAPKVMLPAPSGDDGPAIFLDFAREAEADEAVKRDVSRVKRIPQEPPPRPPQPSATERVLSASFMISNTDFSSEVKGDSMLDWQRDPNLRTAVEDSRPTDTKVPMDNLTGENSGNQNKQEFLQQPSWAPSSTTPSLQKKREADNESQPTAVHESPLAPKTLEPIIQPQDLYTTLDPEDINIQHLLERPSDLPQHLLERPAVNDPQTDTSSACVSGVSSCALPKPVSHHSSLSQDEAFHSDTSLNMSSLSSALNKPISHHSSQNVSLSSNVSSTTPTSGADSESDNVKIPVVVEQESLSSGWTSLDDSVRQQSGAAMNTQQQQPALLLFQSDTAKTLQSGSDSEIVEEDGEMLSDRESSPNRNPSKHGTWHDAPASTGRPSVR